MTRKMNEKEEDDEDGWEWREKNLRLPSFSSTSRSGGILSDSTEEPPQSGFFGSCWARMEQGRCKLSATPKLSAHAGTSNQGGGDTAVSTTIPPWRNRSLWRITTTNTVEGMADQPKYGVKQHYEHYGSLLMKHAAEYMRLMKEYEDIEATGSTKKEAFETKGKEW